MKYNNFLIVVLIAAFFYTSCENEKTSINESNKVELFSYCYATGLMQQLKAASFSDNEMAPEHLLNGFKDGLKGDTALVNAAEKVINQRMMSRVPSANDTLAHDLAYNIGVILFGRFATEMEINPADFDFGAMKLGFNDALKSDSLKYTPQFVDSVVSDYFEPMMASYNKKMQEKSRAEAEPQIKMGAEFLAQNKTRPEVKTTESGLQYEILKEGKGDFPAITDKVSVHYHGTFINGDVFDSSVDRGQPSEFGLNQVIRGWTEGLQLMNEGAKFKFYIPQELAYGTDGRPGIPPGSTLIFEVELLDILD